MTVFAGLATGGLAVSLSLFLYGVYFFAFASFWGIGGGAADLFGHGLRSHPMNLASSVTKGVVQETSISVEVMDQGIGLYPSTTSSARLSPSSSTPSPSSSSSSHPSPASSSPLSYTSQIPLVTLHKQVSPDNIQVSIITPTLSALDGPLKVDILTTHQQKITQYNTSQVDSNTWTGLIPIDSTICINYHVEVFSNLRWTRYPQTNEITIQDLDYCIVEEGEESTYDALYFSVLLYVLLIAGCLFL